jgi:multicomponent Na+:H+ antiporter subunit D
MVVSYIPSLYILVLLPVVVGAIGYFAPRKFYQALLLIFGIVMIGLSWQIFYQVRFMGEIIEQVAGWSTSISISLRADQYSAPLVLMTNVLFFMFFVFNTRAPYMDNTFQYLFMTLQCALLAMFLSGDLFNVYVVMEVGMLAVCILIMYKKEKQSVYDGMVYLMINFLAMAFMVLGIGYLYRITGVLDFIGMREKIALIQDPKSLILPYSLIMTAIALKAALFPLFSWLPRAHGAPSAPSIISSTLSGVQVKIGVYLLIRMQWVFEPAINASGFFAMLGFITAVAGFLLAVSQKDLKLILAYHTVSQVGLIILGLNAGSTYAFWGGMYHIINHALFKGLLFLTAGVIIDQYHTRNYSEIRGVFKRMPWIGIAGFAGVLGITGTPLFNGSISKYLIQNGLQGNLAEIGMFIVNLGTVLSFVKYSTMFFGNPPDHVKPLKDPFMNGVSMVVGFGCLAGGIFGAQAVQLFFNQNYNLQGAYGLEKVLMYLLTLGLGILLYVYGVRKIGYVLQWVRSKKLYFNQVGMLITAFFGFLTFYLFLTV